MVVGPRPWCFALGWLASTITTAASHTAPPRPDPLAAGSNNLPRDPGAALRGFSLCGVTLLAVLSVYREPPMVRRQSHEVTVGVDVSSRLYAAVAIDTGSLEAVATWHVPLDRGPQGPVQALRAAVATTEKLPDPQRVRLVAIEAPAMGVSPRSTILQSFCNGAVQAAVGMGGYEMLLVAPATWKKETIGRGNVDKPTVASWLRSKHPRLADACGRSQDLTDAACLALYGAAILARSARMAG